MKQCSVYCVSTEKDAIADILEMNDKRLKVVIEGTDMTIVLTRNDMRRPYIGMLHGMEFESFGELE